MKIACSEYSEREMRLIGERDAALTRAENKEALLKLADDLLPRLTKNRDEALQLVNDQAHHISRLTAECDKAEAALATARAVAVEEAAQVADKRIAYHSSDLAACAEEHRAWTASRIRALAQTPPGLVVLRAEDAQWIENHLATRLRNINEASECEDCGTIDDHESDCFALELERRLAALTAAREGK